MAWSEPGVVRKDDATTAVEPAAARANAVTGTHDLIAVRLM